METPEIIDVAENDILLISRFFYRIANNGEQATDKGWLFKESITESEQTQRERFKAENRKIVRAGFGWLIRLNGKIYCLERAMYFECQLIEMTGDLNGQYT